MKNLLFAFAILLTLFVSDGLFAQSPTKQSKALIGLAKSRIEALSKNPARADHPIQVVYFHANDQEPLQGWQDRLPRTLEAVSTYYREAFSRFGLKSSGLPFVREKGVVQIQCIRGDLEAKKYNLISMTAIEQDIQRKAQGKIDFARDNVLIITGFCDKLPNGIYSFHSPYGGRGNVSNGECIVVDCELLDCNLLTDTLHKMTFTEMAVKNKTCPVAEFNSWYIGGIAHEMGHIFGLPHDFGGPYEFPLDETSLMGEYGSRHFRDYLWKGEKTSYFSTASILQLMSHPAFTGLSVTEDQASAFSLESTSVLPNASLRFRFQSKFQPYGVVCLVHSVLESEYRSLSFPQIVPATDSVDVKLMGLNAGKYDVRVLFLFPNGCSKNLYLTLLVDSTGTWTVEQSELSAGLNLKKLKTRLEGQPKNLLNEQKLDIVKDALEPAPLLDLKTFEGQNAYLSDAKWLEANVGWGKLARNYFSLENEILFYLTLNGKIYSKGLYAHSASNFVFDLGGTWKTLTATVGLRDLAHMQGSARFIVYGDGKELYRSAALRVNQQEEVKVDISGVKLLKLHTEGTEGHNHNSWAIWVDPNVQK